MSPWNYRVIHTRPERTDTDAYEIHEVYYNDDDHIEAWTENPVGPYGETLEELRIDIQHVLEATRKPVLKIVQDGERERLVEEGESGD